MREVFARQHVHGELNRRGFIGPDQGRVVHGRDRMDCLGEMAADTRPHISAYHHSRTRVFPQERVLNSVDSADPGNEVRRTLSTIITGQ